MDRMSLIHHPQQQSVQLKHVQLMYVIIVVFVKKLIMGQASNASVHLVGLALAANTVSFHDVHLDLSVK